MEIRRRRRRTRCQRGSRRGQALANLAFTDIASDVKPEAWAKARSFVADTYDNLVYTIKIAKKADSDDYYLTVAISGEPPRERTPEKGEKPATRNASTSSSPRRW